MPLQLSYYNINITTATEIYTLSLHDALPISASEGNRHVEAGRGILRAMADQEPEISHGRRSEEHTSELQSRGHLVCRLLLEKKKKTEKALHIDYTSIH